MSIWFGAWREDGIMPDYKKPGGDEFFLQIRFRHHVKRDNYDDESDEENAEKKIMFKEEGESLTMKSFLVKKSAVFSPSVESVNSLFDMLRLVGVHPKVCLMCPMITEICSFARKRTQNEDDDDDDGQIDPFIFGIGLVDSQVSTTALSSTGDRIPADVMERLLDDLRS